MKRIVQWIGCWLLVLGSVGAWGQQNVFSRSEVSTGNWWDAANPWFYSTNGNQNRPDNFSTRHNVFIGHNNNLTMTTNGAFFQLRRLEFEVGASSARTINNSSGGISLTVDLTNNSAATHIFNTPIGIDGSTVTFNAAFGGLTFNSNVFLNANTLDVAGGNNITISGIISGTGATAITKTGTGTLILSGANTYTGTTTITAGTLQLGAANRINDASNLILNGGSFSTGATTGFSETVGTLNLNANSTIALGTGIHTLTFANSSGVAWAGSLLTITGWTGPNNGVGTGTTGRIFIGNSAAGLTPSQLSRIVFDIGGIVYSAVQLSTGEIVGSGAIPLYYGGAAAAWNTANWSTNNVAPYTTAWTDGRHAIFNIESATLTGATVNFPYLTVNENVTITSPSGTIGVAGQTSRIFVASGRTMDFAGQAFSTSGTYGIIKNGPGTLALAGNTYGGGFTLNEGMVVARGVNAMGDGGSLTINGGTLASTANRDFTDKLDLGINIGGDFTLGSSTAPASGTANLIFNNNTSLGSFTTRTIILGGTGTYTWNGVISGTGSNLVLNATAAGTLALGGANTYGGNTTINGGTLRCDAANTLPATTGLTLANTSGVSLNLNNFSQTIASLSGGGTTGGNIALGSATLTVNQATNTTYSGIISGTGGGLTKNGSATLTLSGVNTYTGTTTISGGTLQLGAADRISNSSSIVLNGGSLSTGATTGFAETVGTLNLSENSSINLGTGSHNLRFASSSGALWTAGRTLTINGWTGVALTTGTGGRIFFGSDNTGLTPAQLSQISFTGYPGTPVLLATGELVPNGITYTWNGSISNEWATAANWTPSSGSGTPGSGDLVIIPGTGAYTNTLSISGTRACNSFTVNGNGVFGMASGSVLTVNGNFVYSSSGVSTFDCTSTLNISSATTQTIPALNYGNLNLTGGPRMLANNGNTGICGTFTPGTGTYTTTGSTVVFNGTTAQNVPGITTAPVADGYRGLRISNTAATVSASSALTVSGSLVIDASARLDMGTNTLTITGSTSTVNGFLRSAGTITGASTSTLTFSATGTYEHNYTTTAGTIPTATWSTGSTCAVIGYTTNTSAPAGIGQLFSNFTWNTTSMTTGACQLAGGLVSISGTFRIISTGTRAIRLVQSNGGVYAANFGNIIIDGGTLSLLGGGSAGSNSSTITVPGSISVNGGVLDFNDIDNGGIVTVNVGGSFTQSSTGIIRRNVNSLATNSFINFNGSLNQSINVGTSTNVQNTLNYTLNNPAGITITGTLPVNNNATFTRTQGAVAGTVTYGTGTTLVYNNTTALTQSGEWPAVSGPVNLTISQPGGVTMSGARTIAGTVSLSAAAGSLNLAGNTLTLNNGSAAQSITGTAGNSFIINSSPAGGILSTTGSGSRTITLSNFGTSSSAGLVIGAGATLQMNSNAILNVGGDGISTSMLTIAGTLQMNSNIASNIASGTAPFYTNTSTLAYRITYDAFQEWIAGTSQSTPGVPQNVIIDGSSATFRILGDRTALGNFSITSGTFVPLASLTVGGNWSNTGTFNPNGHTVTFNGNTSQSITRTGGETFFNLMLNNATGLVPANAITVTNTLTLTTGNITLGANNLHITSGNDIGGAPFSASKMIITNGAGKLIFSTLTNKTYTYPVGETTGTTEYSPISITFTAGTGAGTSLGMQVVDAAVPANPLEIPTAPFEYLTRHWLPDAQGFTTATWSGSISFPAADEVGNRNNLRFSAWHPTPNNAWVDYGTGPTGQTLNGTSVTAIDALLTTAYITGRAPAAKFYFRSNANNMNWSTAANWQTSLTEDFASPAIATFVPSALNSLGITIISGHTVTIDGAVSLDQAIVQNNAILIKGNADLTINNGTGTDLEIQSGGIYRHASTAGNNPTFAAGSEIVVRSGGMIDITSNFTGATIYGTSTSVTYENNAIFNWAINNPFSASGQTFFPGIPESVIPIFRISTAISLPVGGGANTIINGLLEVNGNVSWNGSGTKTFRNGIIGSGNITQATGCGTFQINGATSVVGGTGTLQLDANGMTIDNGTCTVLNNKTINALGGGQVRVISNISAAIIDFQGYSWSGTAGYNHTNAFTTIITSHASGINGSIGSLSGSKTFADNVNYTFTGSGNQATGSLMGLIAANIRIAKANATDRVVLSNNNTRVTNLILTNGRFGAGNGNTLQFGDGTGTNNVSSLRGIGPDGENGTLLTDSDAGLLRFTNYTDVFGNISLQLLNVECVNNETPLGVRFLTSSNIASQTASVPVILGYLKILSQGFVSRAPIYNSGSSLIYASGGNYSRTTEWGNAPVENNPGYPHHVLVEADTYLLLHEEPISFSTLAMAGDLYIGTSQGRGSVALNNVNQNRIEDTRPLEIRGNLIIGSHPNGETSLLRLGTNNGADLILWGDFVRYNNSFYDDAGRAIFFRGPQNSSIRTPNVTNPPGVPSQFLSFAIIDKENDYDNTITLECSVGITGQLIMIGGRVVTSTANILSVTNVAPDIGFNGIAYNDGNPAYIDGPLRRSVDNITGSSNYVFPVGRFSGGFHYIKRIRMKELSNGTGTFTVTYERGNPPGGFPYNFQDIIKGIRETEYWNVDRTSGSTEGRIVLPYTYIPGNPWLDMFGDGITPNIDARVAIVRGSGANWNVTDPLNSIFTNDGSEPEGRLIGTDGDVSSRHIENFSPFTFGWGLNQVLVLPVTLHSFTATLQGGDGLLRWEIDDAKDLRHFELQHSTDGQRFATLATLPRQEATGYSYRHRMLSAGVHHYRLAIVEKDGRRHYSRIEMLQVGTQRTLISGLLHNPVVGGQAIVRLQSATAQSAQAVVIDMAGRVLLRQQVQLMAGANQVPLSMLPLPAGHYRLLFRTADGVEKVMPLLR